jgi:branched-chain amino acid transport system ATP-binding protein
MDAMLATQDVTGGYGSVQILNGVTLRVGRGQMVALLGGNGTGKSTMLKVLSGLLRPWSGTITFDGERIDGLRPDHIVRRGLVQVTQGKEAYPGMTVEENLLLGAHTKPDRATRARGLERAYTYFPILEERRRQLTGTLSGGQLQMLCIARGLMSEPRMMLLDEPSAALAPQVVLDIFRTIGRICRDGMTLLMVEQNVRMALLLVEYGYVIKDGVIHLEGPSERMIDDDAVRLSYLGGTVADRDARMAM